MTDNSLTSKQDNTLGSRLIKIKLVYKVNEYLFIELDNGQKLLINGQEIYDVSKYDRLVDTFNMGDKPCALMRRFSLLYLIDLKTMEVLYEDSNAYYIKKADERMLDIIMHTGYGDNAIYNIETKKYLRIPGYEFERALANNLYVFRESRKANTDFYARKRCIVNADGKILLKDIEGWIYASDNHLIITKEDEISTVGVNDEVLEMKTIKSGGTVLFKPEVYEGNIVIIESGTIKIYTPSFKLLKEIKIEEFEKVIDAEIVADTLKICIPFMLDGKQINKHLFVNLKTGKSISHIRIEGYSYHNPTTYVGQDELGDQLKSYYFYDENFELLKEAPANEKIEVNSRTNSMFLLQTKTNDGTEQQLYNTKTGIIKDCNYAYIQFDIFNPYGYGVNIQNETIDFFDEELNVIVPNFEYKKFNMTFGQFGFNYFIVNSYVCVIYHYVDDYGRSRFRNVIQSATGEILLDSIYHKCYQIGDFIQIIGHDGTQFLNTLTGEIGDLNLTGPVDATGNIIFAEINDINNLLIVGANGRLSLPSVTENSMPKVKKLKHDSKKED